MIGLVSLDVYHSTKLLEQDPGADRIIDELHRLVGECFQRHHGQHWHAAGDGTLYTFRRTQDAVEACVQLLDDDLGTFNSGVIRDGGSPLYVRIGVATADDALCDIPERDRGRATDPALNRVTRLQEASPVGGMTITRDVAAQIGPYIWMFRPPASAALRHQGALVCRLRQAMPYARHLLSELTERQRMSIPPLVELERKRLIPERSLRDLRWILQQPLLVVLGETDRADDSRIGRAASSDAVGMAELLASVGENRQTVAVVDEWEDAADLATSHNVMVIGLANTYAWVVNDLLEPVRFQRHQGSFLNRVVATGPDGHGGRQEWEFGERNDRVPHCGLVVLSRSPFAPEHDLLWIAGSSGPDTLAASQFVLNMVMDPVATLDQARVPAGFTPTACVIGSPDKERMVRRERPGRGQPGLHPRRGGAQAHPRRWHARDYRLVWATTAGGECVTPGP